MNEATEKYPTKAVDLKHLKMLELEHRRQAKNSFSMLPPGHQELITRTIEATIEQQLINQQQLILEKNVKMESLYQ